MKTFILNCPDDTKIVSATLMCITESGSVNVLTTSALFAKGEIDFCALDKRDKADMENQNGL